MLYKHVHFWHITNMTLEQYMTEHSLTDAEVAAMIGRERSVVTKLRNRQISCSLEIAAILQRISNGRITAMDLLPDKPGKARAMTAEPGFAEDAAPYTFEPAKVIVAKDRDMRKLMQRITMNKDIVGGKPCIRGMRIRVTDVVNLVASGAPWSEILEDFPYLEHDDIVAALQYAANAVGHRIVRTG